MDLEKHVENKCNGFEIECFACLQKIKTLKTIRKHVKYECPQIKINCYLCGNWFTRAHFKDQKQHGCHFDICQILQKFQGNNAQDEHDAELEELEAQFSTAVQLPDAQKTPEQLAMEKYIQLSKAKAVARVSQPCMDQLPLAMNLLCFQKGKSFIDKRHCLNEYCFWNFHFQVSNYASEIKLTLLKSDNEQRYRCSKCNN